MTQRFFKIVLLTLFSLFLTLGTAQKFVASTNAKQVIENNPVQLSWTLHNADGRNLKIPKVSNFEAVSGPSTSTNMQIINGRSSRSTTYTYNFLPKKPGNYKIPSATITVNNKEISSNPLTIEVIKAESLTKNGSGKPYFVKIILSTENAYVGQQVTLDYKLYTQVDIRSFDILNESDYDGFYARNYNIRVSNEQEVVDGQMYTTKLVKRVILFAQQTGTYTIGPSTIQLGLAPKNQSQNPFGSFFRSNLQRVNTVAEAATLRVGDVPPSGNLSASNAVGTYGMNATINQQRVTTDDAITISMTVNGDGDSRFVSAPKFINEDDFDVYDPNVKHEDDYNSGNKIMNKKVFEYLAVPKRPGTYVIKPEFEYFDVSTGKHKILRSRSMSIQVSQGQGNKNFNLENENEKVELAAIAATTKFTQTTSGFYKSILYYLSLLGCVIAMIGSFFVYQKRKKEGQLDPRMILQQKARRLALEKLAKANDFKAKKERSAFYEEIIRALKEYLSDKFQVPAKHLKKSTIQSSLLSKGANPNAVEELVELFNTCELNLYASSSDSDMESSFTQAQNLIEQLESITSEDA